MQITIDSRDAAAGLLKLGRAGKTGLARALRRSTTTASTYLGRQVAKDTGMRVTDVRRAITVAFNTERTVATITARGTRIPLIAFRARGPVPSRGRGRGVSALVGDVRKVYPHAFIATVRGPLPTGVVSPGHRGVFQRRGRSRLPIRQLYGPSIPHVFSKFLPEAATRATEALQKSLAHELQFALTKQ